VFVLPKPRSALLLGAAIVMLAAATRFVEAQESIEAKFLTNIRQVTTSGFVKAGEGYFTPDAETIVYQAIRPEYPFFQIFTQPLAGGTPKLISTGQGRTTCAYFSPDGSRILFASAHLHPDLPGIEARERQKQEAEKQSGRRAHYSWDFDPYMDIFVSDLEGKILQRLTDEYGYDAEGAYSSDGTKIAYCHVEEPKSAPGDEPAKGNADIYVMNADGTGKRRITSAAGYDGGPFISPDGRWIVYRTDRLRENYLQIHVIGIDGQHDTALTNDLTGVHWGPYWHPTKPYLIWSAAGHSNPLARPNYDLYLMRYEVRGSEFRAGQVTRITDHASADVLPVFSPDGTRLMWTSTRTEDRGSQLFIADFRAPDEPEDSR